MNIIKKKWATPRIVFSFLDCPSCKRRIEAGHCQILAPFIAEAKEVEKVIIKKAVERAKHEEIDKDPRLKDPNDHYFNKLE